MTDPETFDAFSGMIHRLQGLTCWSVQISGVGSLANLHFGGKVKRNEPMLHPRLELTHDERMLQGEIVLYLEECPWRLDSATEVVCSWMDDSNRGGRLAEGLMRLKDRPVERTAIIRPALDLVIAFEGGLTLRIFPDQADPEEGDNYALNADGQTFIVAAQSTLYLE